MFVSVSDAVHYCNTASELMFMYATLATENSLCLMSHALMGETLCQGLKHQQKSNFNLTIAHELDILMQAYHVSISVYK